MECVFLVEALPALYLAVGYHKSVERIKVKCNILLSFVYNQQKLNIIIFKGMSQLTATMTLAKVRGGEKDAGLRKSYFKV